MDLQLNGDEVELLRSVLDSTVRDMSPEIADTDNPEYRRELKARRDTLRDILQRLSGAATA